jgi:hypothetical protein
VVERRPRPQQSPQVRWAKHLEVDAYYMTHVLFTAAGCSGAVNGRSVCYQQRRSREPNRFSFRGGEASVDSCSCFGDQPLGAAVGIPDPGAAVG